MKSFLAGVLVATVISAGVTYAVASTSSETITACAHKRTGDLRIMTGKKCKKSERAVSWSAGAAQVTQGVAGPKGDTGSPGAQGAPGVDGLPGANGLSRGYWYAIGGSYVNAPDNGFLGMAEIELPAGSFVITATSDVRSDKQRCEDEGVEDCSGLTTGVASNCRFTSTNNDGFGPRFIGYSRGQDASQITLQGHITNTDNTTVTVECANDNPVGRVWHDVMIYAIALDEITQYSSFFPCSRSQNRNEAVTAVC